MDHSLNIIKKEKLLYGNINCIQKIHDEFFLASTDDGAILQITIEKKNNCPQLEIKGKKFISKEIYSLILKNINTILFTYDKGFQILTLQKENCIHF